MIITVSGLSGSGTTTLSKILAESLRIRYHKDNLCYIYAGKIFREMAKKKGMTVEEFSEFAKKHLEIDRELDQLVLVEAKKGDCILEGRLSGYMVHKNNIPAFKIWLQVNAKNQARRISTRENISEEKAHELSTARDRADYERYKILYGISGQEKDFYDLIIDTNQLSSDEVSRTAINSIDKWLKFNSSIKN